MPNQKNHWKNKLYFGDNLDILRDKIPNNFVDLIYLDPPFQSGRTYNIIFQPEMGEIKGATAQIKTFEDTWKWGAEAERNYEGLINGTITKEKPNQKLIDLVSAMRSYLGECSMMAYLSMMAPRLLEMKRVLKNTGSIYLHCDPTASHYLKILMDAIFKVDNFRNEIIWRRGRVFFHTIANQFPRNHDVILFYSKSRKNFFKPQFKPYKETTLQMFRYDDRDGKGRYRLQEVRTYGKQTLKEKLDKGEAVEKDGKIYIKQYLSRKKGNVIDTIWEDIESASYLPEKIGYPTQKPEKLLERIINASSNKGDLVLDPFCGCGTTIAVAERLGRRWIGIDITYLAIDVISKRLKRSGIKENVDYEIDGEPKEVYSAKKLAEKDPFQFQIWCISKLNATPSETKSADRGVDGIINFFDPSKSSKVGKAIIQVKGTENVNPSMVRDLKGTLKSQNADFGILITFKKPTQGMKEEAIKEGYFKFMGREIPKIQFLTIEDLFKGPIPITLPHSFIFEPYRKPVIEKELEEEIQQTLFKQK